ncbi:MAG TPA: FAD-binding oxidoreductase [Bryobacteraceae bacterium]|jgi:CDP-4-dehydro-6-deoxyglucose reductase
MTARLIHSVEAAPDLRRFFFEVEELARLEFVPGQFVSFTADIGDKEITRAYSIASAPDGTNRFELLLNRVPDGLFSTRLFAMQPDETIGMRPPLGMFVIRNAARDAVLIATGTGVAPMRSMLLANLNEGSPGYTLLYGVRHESHLMYREEFEEMVRRFPQFRFWPIVSRPDEGWKGRIGHVQHHLELALGGRVDVDLYLCGLKLMVDDVRAILKGKGFDRKQIIYEKYD